MGGGGRLPHRTGRSYKGSEARGMRTQEEPQASSGEECPWRDWTEPKKGWEGTGRLSPGWRLAWEGEEDSGEGLSFPVTGVWWEVWAELWD